MGMREAIQKLQEVDINDIRNIDVEDLKKIGTAPRPAQYAVMGLVAAVIIAAMGWFLVKPAYSEYQDARQKEQELKAEFKDMQSKAAKLDAYKAQLEEMRNQLDTTLKQLPRDTDMEALLETLSQEALEADLSVNYFKPASEIKKEFYAEYPIKLRVSGSYHEFGKFVSGLASVPRIVTLHDIQIKRAESGKSSSGNGGGNQEISKLSMTLTAKTYRSLQQ